MSNNVNTKFNRFWGDGQDIFKVEFANGQKMYIYPNMLKDWLAGGNLYLRFCHALYNMAGLKIWTIRQKHDNGLVGQVTVK